MSLSLNWLRKIHLHRWKLLSIGGTANHLHLLLSMSSSLSVAKALQLIKGGSSKWIHDTFPEHQSFAWQEGYAAFSVGISQMPDTLAYIQRQEEHHHKKTFEEEFVAFLKKHNMEYDERYLWG
ncbi:MAG: transposase [SAR324 cluster bacterium]|nr:transposase [SAR324 cluster bacterium]